MESKIEQITPERAEALLKTNVDHNRHVQKNRVERYAADMTAGEWKLNGESIKLDETGRLVDGQHRLKAVVASAKTVEMLVTTGVKADAFDTLDTGKNRSGADVLSIIGIRKNKGAIAAGITGYLQLMGEHVKKFHGTGKGRNRATVRPAQILAEFTANRDLYLQLFEDGKDLSAGVNHTLLPQHYITHYRYFQTKVSEANIDLFFKLYEQQEGIPGLLRTTIVNAAVAKRNFTIYEKRTLINKAFVMFMNRSEAKQLRVSRGEIFLLDQLKNVIDHPVEEEVV